MDTNEIIALLDQDKYGLTEVYHVTTFKAHSFELGSYIYIDILDAGAECEGAGRYTCALRENGEAPFHYGNPQNDIETAIEDALIQTPS